MFKPYTTCSTVTDSILSFGWGSTNQSTVRAVILSKILFSEMPTLQSYLVPWSGIIPTLQCIYKLIIDFQGSNVIGCLVIETFTCDVIVFSEPWKMSAFSSVKKVSTCVYYVMLHL